MDATYRSTQSPYSGASPTQLVNGKLAAAHSSSKVAQEKDQVLAAALSEYCRLKEDGASPEIAEFCRRYPTYHKSIQRMIDVEQTLDKLDDFDDVEWPEVGSNFMGFDVLHELGVGAFARVYLAAEPALGGRLVAVKVAMYGSDEAETLGKLVHPNVVPVHSVRDDPESGMTAVCMPYLGSATLSDVIEQVFQDGVPREGSTILKAVARREVVGNSTAGLPEVEAEKTLRRGSYVDAVVRLGIQMAEALVYTHAQGVLHRDLKPSNVLITPAGQPKLLDFNLSCDVETEVNRLGGTLPYMPPEQINDVFLRPFDAKPPTDPRSDLFSLGVILYELLTGELPFGIPPSNIPPVDAGGVYLKAQQSPPKPIQQLNPAVESQTAQLIERCVAPNPDCRPANAADLVAELGSHFSLPRQVRRWSAVNKYALVAAGLVTVALLVSLSWHLLTRPSRDRRLYNDGLKAMKNKDYYQAIIYFDEAHHLNEDQPAIRLARGRCNQLRNEHVLAHEDFKEIGEGDCEPIVKEVYAFSFFAKGESFRGASRYSTLISEDPQDPEALQMKVNLAFANYDLSNQGFPPGTALKQASDILRIDPTCQAALHIRAMSINAHFSDHRFKVPVDGQKFADRHDLVDALQDYETAMAVGASNPYLEIGRLKILAKLAQHDPHLVEAFSAEMESQLKATQMNQQMLDTPLFDSIKDEPWFAKAKAGCPKTPARKLIFYIVEPPSEEAIQQFLNREWNSLE